MNDKLRQAEEHFERGNQLDEAGDTEHAIQEWQAAIALSPDKWEAHDNLAVAYRKQGKYDLAEKELREALRIRPNDADTHYYLANLYDERKDFANAAAEYYVALRLDPDDLTRGELAHVLIEQGDLVQARIELEQISDKDETVAELWTRLGEEANKQGDRALAVEANTRILEIKTTLNEFEAKLERKFRIYTLLLRGVIALGIGIYLVVRFGHLLGDLVNQVTNFFHF